MIRALSNTLIILVASALAGWATWKIQGPPDLAITCSPADLKPGEICYADIPKENVLWIDARPRTQWEKNGVPDSLLLTDDRHENWEDLLAEVAPRLFEAEMAVIYCDTKACGSSEPVAQKLRALNLGPEIKVLHGGFQALPKK